MLRRRSHALIALAPALPLRIMTGEEQQPAVFAEDATLRALRQRRPWRA